MNRLFSILLLLCIASNYIVAQTVIGDSIVVESKKGTLAKMLKNWKYTDVKKIKVMGELGAKDMEALQSTSFTTIDLSETFYIGNKFWYLGNDLYKGSKDKMFTECEFNVPLPTKLLKMFKCGKRGNNLVALSLRLEGSPDASLSVFVSGKCSLDMRFGNHYHTTSILKVQLYSDSEDNSPVCSRNGGANIIDILEVPNVSYYNRCNTIFEYFVLREMDNGNVFIRMWNKDFGKEYLENATELGELVHFKGLSGSVSMPKVKTLPNFCFLESPHLTEVHLGRIERIEYSAFSQTSVSSVILPATIKSLHGDAFVGAKIATVEFEGTTPPSFGLTEDRSYQYKDVCFIVPKGALQNYSSGIWNKLRVREKGFNPNAAIHCDKPGTFSSYLTQDIITNTDNLVVTGTIYDTEKDLVKQIKWLKNVDWSGTTIVKSPQTIAAEHKAEQERIQWEKNRPKAKYHQQAKEVTCPICWGQGYYDGSQPERINGVWVTKRYRCTNCYGRGYTMEHYY